MSFNKENMRKHNNEEQQQADDWAVCRTTDSSEVRDLKSKMKLIMNKLTVTKKDKEQLQKQNKTLQEEVLTLQSNLRQMIPGFSNTSCSFPIHNQLANRIAEFYKYDCLDKFFDLLCPELNIKGILFFYTTAFAKINALIHTYMHPALSELKRVGCLATLEGPIMNVLRKSFQANHKSILEQLTGNNSIKPVLDHIQGELQLGGMSPDTNSQLSQFLSKLAEILLFCYISDPPMVLDLQSMGKKVVFNPLKHDPFDGFIKPKQECWVVLPEIRRGDSGGEVVSKSLVLQTSYDIIH